jgi:hypothetical protein
MFDAEFHNNIGEEWERVNHLQVASEIGTLMESMFTSRG